jgi:FXSXX-COOH protein
MGDGTGDYGDVLIDVRGLSLRDLDTIGESSLAKALRLVLDGEDGAPVAGFQSAIPDEA